MRGGSKRILNIAVRPRSARDWPTALAISRGGQFLQKRIDPYAGNARRAVFGTWGNGYYWDEIAVVEPDYFANRKLVSFFGGEVVPISLRYQGSPSENGLISIELKPHLRRTKVFVFSTPNNPTGLIFSKRSIETISALAADMMDLIVDQLYSRLLYSGEVFTHLCACEILPENLITMGHRRWSSQRFPSWCCIRYIKFH